MHIYQANKSDGSFTLVERSDLSVLSLIVQLVFFFEFNRFLLNLQVVSASQNRILIRLFIEIFRELKLTKSSALGKEKWTVLVGGRLGGCRRMSYQMI